MRYSIAVSLQDGRFDAIAYRGDIRSRLAEIAGLGFDGVELAIRDPGLVDGEQLAQLASRHRLKIVAVSSGLAFLEDGLSLASASADVRRAATDRLLSHLPLAARFGSLLIIGLIATGTLDGQSVEAGTDQLLTALDEVAAAARERAVRLAIEPINRYESALIRTVDEGLALIGRLAAPNVGLLLDTFHMNIEEASLTDSVRMAAGHISHFQVADSNRRHPGAGHIDFGSVLDALTSTGYDGFVSGEFLPLPDSSTSAQAFLAHMRALDARPRPGEEATRRSSAPA